MAFNGQKKNHCAKNACWFQSALTLRNVMIIDMLHRYFGNEGHLDIFLLPTR